jgi:hypothetical protein
MPLIYETTAELADNGWLSVNMEELPFEKGTKFLVKLIPELPPEAEIFRQRMRSLIEKCSENSPYGNMGREDILAELRRQREEMNP